MRKQVVASCDQDLFFGGLVEHVPLIAFIQLVVKIAIRTFMFCSLLPLSFQLYNGILCSFTTS